MTMTNRTTPIFPHGAEEITPGADVFKPSAIWVDEGGTIVVVPADNKDTGTTVPFVMPGAGCVPCMCVRVASFTGTGIKRLS